MKHFTFYKQDGSIIINPSENKDTTKLDFESNNSAENWTMNHMLIMIESNSKKSIYPQIITEDSKMSTLEKEFVVNVNFALFYTFFCNPSKLFTN